MSTAHPIHHLSPAFPGRAPWGTAGALRAWQQAALDEYARRRPRDFLAVATPGAGKTTFALTLAGQLLRSHTVQQLTVVASPMSGFPRRYPGRNTADGMYLDRCEPSFRAFVHEHHLADTSIVRSTVGATAEVWPHLLDRVPCVVSREA